MDALADALADGWPLECQGMPIMHNMTRANVTIIKLENYHVLLLQPWIEHRRYVTIQEGDDQWVAGGDQARCILSAYTVLVYHFATLSDGVPKSKYEGQCNHSGLVLY